MPLHLFTYSALTENAGLLVQSEARGGQFSGNPVREASEVSPNVAGTANMQRRGEVRLGLSGDNLPFPATSVPRTFQTKSLTSSD